jgi:uncharacterized protein YjiS (DUF1127 family)
MTEMPMRPSRAVPVVLSWPPARRRRPGLFAWLTRAFLRWRRREQAVAELARLDDLTLADIGLHRSEIRSAVIDADEPNRLRERRRCR